MNEKDAVEADPDVSLVCLQSQVQTSQSYLGPAIARPNHIYVSYFAVTPDEVRLDQGVGARLARVARAESVSVEEGKAAQQTQAALAEHIVDRLKQYGLPAEIAPQPVVGANDVLVQCQIVSIDQGNRTRRLLIGLGAGKSSIGADAQLYHLTNSAPPRFIMAFAGRADSGRMPGAAETMGAGAAAQTVGTTAVLTGAVHAGSETRKASETAEAGELADELAFKIGQFAVTQGWISQSALK